MKRLTITVEQTWHPIQVRDRLRDKLLAEKLWRRKTEEEVLLTEDKLEVEVRQGLFKKQSFSLDLAGMLAPILRIRGRRLAYIVHRWVLPLYVVVAFLPRIILPEDAYAPFANVAYLPLGIVGAAVMLYLLYEYTLGRKKQFTIQLEDG